MDHNTSGGYFVSQFDPSNNERSGMGSNQTETTDKRNLVSVSLSQVIHLTRKETGLVIHRQKVHSLTAVGLVLNIEELTTKNIYTITDQSRSAPIEVQYWKNDDSSGGSQTGQTNNSRYVAPPPVMEKTYIRVIGQARYDDKKPFIVAFRVEPILDPNEIYMHLLEVIQDSMILQRRKNDTLSGSVDPIQPINNNSFGGNIDNSEPRIMQGFNDIQKTVLNLINKSSDQFSAGMKRQDIIKSIPGVSPHLIEQAISFLANEGHIFSTTDEDTFKSTDS